MKICPLSYITLGNSLDLSYFRCTQLWKLTLIDFFTPELADFVVSFVFLCVLVLSIYLCLNWSFGHVSGNKVLVVLTVMS